MFSKILKYGRGKVKNSAGRDLLRGTQKHGRGGFLQNNEFLGKIPEISLKSQKLCGEASKYGRGETSCGGIDNLVRGGILKNTQNFTIFSNFLSILGIFTIFFPNFTNFGDFSPIFTENCGFHVFIIKCGVNYLYYFCIFYQKILFFTKT